MGDAAHKTLPPTPSVPSSTDRALADPTAPNESPFLRRLLRSFRRPAEPSGAVGIKHAQRALALCHALLAEKGEVSVAKLAAEALEACISLDDAALEVFWQGLADQFLPDQERARQAAEEYADDPSPISLMQLQMAVESPRQELFRRLNMSPGGTAALVGLRRQFLPTLKDHPERAGIDADFVHLFRSWFNRGFLVLRRIDWRTPALVLERLIQYEAVHQIQGWGDLRRRLESDRRCYAFFHPALPDEPLIFIEVALTKGIPASVQPLLDVDAPVGDPDEADCAVFYSITNCQSGLRGVSFGNFLIKQAVEDLRRDLRRLRTFATLSPVPGFVAWLTTSTNVPPRSPQLTELLYRLGKGELLADKSIPEQLRREILTSCAHYLLNAKRGTEPLDSVARFHLTNGARLDRLNWMGDTSETGIRQSLGLTANYVYRLAEVERNHEAYAKTGKVVASHDIETLARKLPTASGRARISRALRS
jgi:malonyl-CoA decarboxylase